MIEKIVRHELRFLVYPDKLEVLLSLLKTLGFEEVRYSDRNITQTIYFNNNYYVLPIGISLKVRRYISQPDKIIKINSKLKYIFEEKTSHYVNNRFTRKKKRQKLTGLQILKKFKRVNLHKIMCSFEKNKQKIPDSFSKIRFKPCFATQYYRKHFTDTNKENIRVTIDQNIEYFRFNNEENTGKLVHTEDFIHIKIKLSDIKSDGLYAKLQAGLEALKAIPARSKKSNVLNIMHKYRPKVAFVKEIKNKELEIKFNIKKINSCLIFLKLRAFFEMTNDDFVIAQKYNYSHDNNAEHVYYKNGKFIEKLSVSNNFFKTTKKGDYISDGISRVEKSTKFTKFYDIEEIEIPKNKIIGRLYRIKKTFWVVNKKTQRFYHVAVDRSYSGNHTLEQLELEYTGSYKKLKTSAKSAENEIKEELKLLQKIVLNNLEISKHLTPTQTTKLSWLLSLDS